MSQLPIPIDEEICLFRGKLIEIVAQNMRIGDKEVVYQKARRPPGIRLLIRANDRILLIREYRTEVNDWDYRLPGGKVFDTIGDYHSFLSRGGKIIEAANKAALKEGHEETGLAISDLHLLGISHCGATIEWDLYYFLGKSSMTSTAKQQLELGENITIEWCSYEKVVSLIFSGKVHEDRSASVLLKYILHTDQESDLRICSEQRTGAASWADLTKIE